MAEENLTMLKVTSAGFMLLKPDLEERIMATMSLGQNELWSSTNMHRQLLWLQGLIPREVCNDLSTFALLILCQAEASSHMWIDTFFFRACAMLPPHHDAVLNVDHVVPAMTFSQSSPATLSGLVNYTAVVPSPQAAGKFDSTWLISTT